MPFIARKSDIPFEQTKTQNSHSTEPLLFFMPRNVSLKCNFLANNSFESSLIRGSDSQLWFLHFIVCFLQRGASTLETKELYSDSQQQAVNMKILESRKRNKEPGGANAGGSQEREESPGHASHYDNSTRQGLESLGGR